MIRAAALIGVCFCLSGCALLAGITAPEWGALGAAAGFGAKAMQFDDDLLNAWLAAKGKKAVPVDSVPAPAPAPPAAPPASTTVPIS